MRTRVDRRILAGVSASAAAVLLVAVFEAWPLNPAVGGAGGATPTAGESTTVLPDGRLLLVGGEGSNGSRAWLLDPQTGTIAPVTGTLSHARAWHTATVLPNGQVLIFGGIDGAGAVVQSAEVFDPATQTFSELSLAFTPRAFHTATLLLDGRVLLAGGVGDGGVPVLSVELLDVTAGAVERLSDPLTVGRSDATTTLLPNGVVVLAGGFDEAGMPLESVALIDPTSGRVVGADSFTPPVEVGPPSLVASLPPDGAAGVALRAVPGVQFSSPLDVTTVTAQTVVLSGPDGPVEAKVVPAEAGLLVFVTPAEALQPGTLYRVELTGLTDAGGIPLAPTEVEFTTSGAGGGASLAPSGPSPSSPRVEPSAPASAAAGQAAEESWTPSPGKPWRTDWPDSPWRSLPALQAPAGVTALAGQVLRLDGEPLTGVSLQIGEHTARTDDSGRFLLTGLTAGHAELMIDGGATHGMFEVGVDLVRGRTTVLPFTVWLPKIDLANAVTIPSPTTEEVVITSPKIPGLEIHIPPNTVIRDYRGQVVKRLSITAIPVDRPPFPLVEPDKVPLYFTVQPGCSYVWNQKGEGARLIYPNPGHEPAGTRFEFWNYDPDDRGWYVYGHGSVISGGTEVVPDPGVSVYEFTGAMVIGSGQGAGSGPGGNCGGGCCDPASGDGDGSSGGCGGGGGGDGSYGGEPVHLPTGLFVQRNTDLFLPDSIPIKLIRTYRQNDGRVRAFGLATTHPYDLFLEGNSFPYTYVNVVLPDGGKIHYDRISSGTDYSDAVYEHLATPTVFYKSHVSWNPALTSARPMGGFDLTLKDGTVYEFQDGYFANRYQEAALVGIRDRFGHHLTLTRSGVCKAGTPGATCITDADCGGTAGSCVAYRNLCQGGTNGGNSCISNADCPGTGGTCVANGNLLKITSPHGRWIAFTYGLSTCPGCVTKMTDNAGRTVQYGYDCSNRLVQVIDAQCGLTTYSYDGATERVVAIRDPSQNATCHPPATPCAALPTTCGPAPAACTSAPTLALTYYGDGTVQTQTLADGTSTYNFSYQMASRCEFGTNAGNACTTNADCNGSVPGGGICFSTSTQTAVKDPRNYYRVVNFNPTGYSTSDAQGATDTVGSNAVRTVTYGRQAGSNLVSTITEPLTTSPTCKQRQTSFGYDPSGNGNLLTVTRKSGPCPAGPYNTTLAQTTFTYLTKFSAIPGATSPTGGPVNVITLNQVASISTLDPSTSTTLTGTTFTYDQGDPLVRLTSITDGAGFVFPVTINGEGQVASIADPQNHATTFSYEGADLVMVTDPTQNTTRRFVDAAGRVRSVTDPLARVTRYDYDNLNRLTQVTDALNGAIALHYDWNGNLDTVTDNRHIPTAAVTHYHYDLLNRLYQRIDPLTRTETFSYDGLGNLTTYTDRRGVVTDFAYDTLNRRTCAGFGRPLGTQANCGQGGLYESVITYGYDDASRLTSAQDTASGLVLRAYDDLDNLTGEESLVDAFFGALIYTYDAASRRATMTVSGQPTIGYCYDGANRFTKIVQGTSCATAPALVNIGYDPAGRRGMVTLSNADTVTYGYDNASRVASLQYNVAGTVHGLTYGYDAAGNRAQLGGDWARTGLPAAMSSGTYDQTDEVQSWNATALPAGAFDLNGNLANDGTNTYHWNARNQLDRISGGVTASVVYDAFGRRIKKSLGTTTTRFLYDGLNPVQELDANAVVTANVLTGLGIDEFFQRTTGLGGSTTPRVFLPDALGSTVALTDQNGALQTQYRYEPFGQESLFAGSVDSNPYQFTGRENDGTGLYYYRARYYSPTWGRFISEDPLEFGSGDFNFYAYVSNNPLRWNDPTGLGDVIGPGGGWRVRPRPPWMPPPLPPGQGKPIPLFPPRLPPPWWLQIPGFCPLPLFLPPVCPGGGIPPCVPIA